jgi:hypothetical protein
LLLQDAARDILKRYEQDILVATSRGALHRR